MAPSIKLAVRQMRDGDASWWEDVRSRGRLPISGEGGHPLHYRDMTLFTSDEGVETREGRKKRNNVRAKQTGKVPLTCV